MSNIDLTYLSEISGGDIAFIREMLDLFLNTTALEINDFDKLLAEKNYEGIGMLAHKMKAPIQMLGASALFEKVRSLENEGKSKLNIDVIPNLINEIKIMLADLKIEIEGLIAKM
jgi:HPt (histidine-containing phosphotransfer) domain-containing protein